MEFKITERSANGLGWNGKAYIIWDCELKGFGVRVQRGSVKSYILHYRIGAGRGAPLRKLTIGKHGSPWTPETARAEAKRLKQLEDENRRLKRLVADLSLDNQMLKFVSEGNW